MLYFKKWIGGAVGRRGAMLLLQLLVLMPALFSHRAFAGTCTGASTTVPISFAASYQAPRDAASGSKEFSSSPQTDYRASNCTANNEYMGYQVQVAGAYTTPTGATYLGAPVYATEVPGVGIVFLVEGQAGIPPQNWLQNWTGATTTATTYLTSTPITVPANYANPIIDVNARLVSYGPITAGTIQGGPVLNVTLYNGGLTGITITYTIPSIAITVSSCTTPDITVPLGTHLSSEIPAIGSTTQAVGFNININSCATGIKTISYRIDSATNVISSTNSVVSLDSSSTGAGVGVQLLDDTGNPLRLGTKRSLSSFVANQSSAQIPLQARYYRTGNLSSGTANTSMTFTMFYQ